MANENNDATKNSTNKTDNPEKLLEKLLEEEPVPAPFISLYLDARVDEHGRRNLLPFVRKQLNERAKTYENHTLEQESFANDSERILEYVENEIPTTARGVAVFACSANSDYFLAGEFDVPFEKNRLFVADRPQVYPLARIIDQYRSFAVLLADTNRARIFVFATGRTVEEQTVENEKTSHSRVGGWSQARYQRHEENYHLRHVKEVVDILEQTVREENIEQVILAGDEETVIPLIRDQLPPALSEKVIEALSLGIDTPEHELLEESLEAFRRHDAVTDQEKVERLLNEFRADDLGAAGVVDTLAALSNGQVEELLIVAAPDKLVFDEEEVKSVLKVYEPDRDLSAELDQRTVADELVRRANQLSAAHVTFIEDHTQLEQVGGVGALLRYRISPENAAAGTGRSSSSPAKTLTTQA